MPAVDCTEAYAGPGSHVNKWDKAMNMIRDYLMCETAKLKKKEALEIKQLRESLKVLNDYI